MKLIKFENCIAVKGFSRSAIYDLQRQKIKFIPNDLCDLLHLHNGKEVSKIKDAYNLQEHSTIVEYIDFLIKNDFAFLSDSNFKFSEMSNEWDSYCEITNSIIDVSEVSNFDLFKVISQLSGLGCVSLQIRIFFSMNIDVLKEYLNEIKSKNYSFKSLEILVRFHEDYTENNVQDLISGFPRVGKIIIYDSPIEKMLKGNANDHTSIFFTKRLLVNEKNCGIISKDFFSINISTFTESINHNSCLNRKLSIDKDGNIKNCPSMNQSFGSIANTSLVEALSHKDFKKYWNITKDQIYVCKDCEFRHVCTDCRAYIKNPEDKYSKPLKCGYSPYTNEWEEWSTNPLKQYAMEYYGMQELVNKDV